MYIFKYAGKTFAATSPFTGFFAKRDCDLAAANLEVYWNDGRSKHKLFTTTPNEWLGIKDRDPKFLRFLYLLLRDTFGDIFKHLYNAVLACIQDPQSLDNKSFEEEYPEFNFGDIVLPQIAGNTINNSYIRPDGLDSSYLKYLLYIKDPVDLFISEEAYNKEIENREFPEGSGNRVPWIGVNDFLSDALFILPYDINANYYAVNFSDENNNPHRRCLLPLKRQALDYLNLENIESHLFVKKYSDSHYAVTLKLNLTNGGNVELRRDYFGVQEKECCFPNGVLQNLQNANRHFAFGIYPFVKSDRFENIYKVLFYNDFKWAEGYKNEDKKKLYDLKFYYFDGNQRAKQFNENQIVSNQTNKADKDFDVNTHYFHVANDVQVNNAYISIDFAELTLDIVRDAHTGNPKHFFGTAIIAPKYHPVASNPGTTKIAVDLGTSNTYISYIHNAKDEQIREISTIHGGWTELTLMNCKCESDIVNRENSEDLYLHTSDKDNPDDRCLPAQLCEFIPSRIKQSKEVKEYGYNFPIPSVLNNLRINGIGDDNFTDRVPLVHSAIPFAYYTLGQRPDTEANRYDDMSNGEFKWFYGVRKDGTVGFIEKKQADFNCFLNELLFVVRSHMLCRGFDLNRCELYWTYPLSFDSRLIRYYQAAWDLSYAKLFCPNALHINGTIANQQLIRNKVFYTNESRSPIYECMNNPAEANHLTVLMDIGGGSTDVIGYKQGQPTFITSFGFAGNALYLGGSKNHPEFLGKKNYLRKFIELNCASAFDSKHPRVKNIKKIDMHADINTVMNYGFSVAPIDFATIFDNPGPQFLLQLHNAALIYHTAQLCKIESPDEMPVSVYLTGNGSKLFDMSNGKKMIRNIFTKVYDKNPDFELKVVYPEDRKAATAVGLLKGIDMPAPDTLKLNDDSNDSKVVLFGDMSTIVSQQQNKYEISDVRKNVDNFIILLFEIIDKKDCYFTKEEVVDALNFVGEDPKLKISPTIIDSYFFQYISLLMEQLSMKMIDKMNN